MPILTKCGNCDRTIKANDRYAGKQGKCPGCGEIVDIPKQGVKDSDPPELEEVHESASDEEGTAGDASAKRRKEIRVVTRILGWVAAVGLFFLMAATQEYPLFTLTLAALCIVVPIGITLLPVIKPSNSTPMMVIRLLRWPALVLAVITLLAMRGHISRLDTYLEDSADNARRVALIDEAKTAYEAGDLREAVRLIKQADGILGAWDYPSYDETDRLREKYVSELGNSGSTPQEQYPVQSGYRGSLYSAEQSGGSGRLTMANYRRIERGMSLSAVESILGSGTEQASGGGMGGPSSSAYKWQKGFRVITVVLLDGQVVSKSQVGLE